MKLLIWSFIPIVIGGVNNKQNIIAIGTKETITQGRRRPHLVCVRSEKYPKIGSLKLFHIDQNKNPNDIKIMSSPTTAK